MAGNAAVTTACSHATNDKNDEQEPDKQSCRGQTVLYRFKDVLVHAQSPPDHGQRIGVWTPPLARKGCGPEDRSRQPVAEQEVLPLLQQPFFNGPAYQNGEEGPDGDVLLHLLQVLPV